MTNMRHNRIHSGGNTGVEPRLLAGFKSHLSSMRELSASLVMSLPVLFWVCIPCGLPLFLLSVSRLLWFSSAVSRSPCVSTFFVICDTIWTSITLNLSGSAGFWEQVWCSVWYSSGSLFFVEFSCCMCTNVHIHPVAVQEASSSQLPPSCSWLQLRARRSLSSESHPCLCSARAGEPSQQAAERSRELMWQK